MLAAYLRANGKVDPDSGRGQGRALEGDHLRLPQPAGEMNLSQPSAHAAPGRRRRATAEMNALRPLLLRPAKLSEVQIVADMPADALAPVAGGGRPAMLKVEIDVAAERAPGQGNRQAGKADPAAARGRLATESFVARAPAAVVEQEKATPGGVPPPPGKTPAATPLKLAHKRKTHVARPTPPGSAAFFCGHDVVLRPGLGLGPSPSSPLALDKTSVWKPEYPAGGGLPERAAAPGVAHGDPAAAKAKGGWPRTRRDGDISREEELAGTEGRHHRSQGLVTSIFHDHPLQGGGQAPSSCRSRTHRPRPSIMAFAAAVVTMIGLYPANCARLTGRPAPRRPTPHPGQGPG